MASYFRKAVDFISETLKNSVLFRIVLAKQQRAMRCEFISNVTMIGQTAAVGMQQARRGHRT